MTDYRSESYKKAAKADAEAASGGKKDKPESKPSDSKAEKAAK